MTGVGFKLRLEVRIRARNSSFPTSMSTCAGLLKCPDEAPWEGMHYRRLMHRPSAPRTRNRLNWCMAGGTRMLHNPIRQAIILAASIVAFNSNVGMVVGILNMFNPFPLFLNTPSNNKNTLGRILPKSSLPFKTCSELGGRVSRLQRPSEHSTSEGNSKSKS